MFSYYYLVLLHYCQKICNKTSGIGSIILSRMSLVLHLINRFPYRDDAYNFLLNTRSSLTGVTFDKWVSSLGGCLQSSSSS